MMMTTMMISTSRIFDPLKNILEFPKPPILELIDNQTYVSKFKIYL